MSSYVLKANGAAASFTSLGGEMTSYVSPSGKEYLWQASPDVWNNSAPVLFPVVGSLIDGKVDIDGQTCEIPKHGSTRRREFTLGLRGEDFVEYLLEADEETKKEYPFDFLLRVVHKISEQGFETEYIVENRSGRDMPMCIGGHPGFRCPLNEGEKFEDYELRFEKVEDGKNLLAPNGYIITGSEYLEGFRRANRLSLSHDLFDSRDALIFPDVSSHSVELVHSVTGKGLLFSFPKFKALGVWSAPNKNAPYLCLEPWHGLPAFEGESGRFMDKPYALSVKPGEAFRIGYSMRIIE